MTPKSIVIRGLLLLSLVMAAVIATRETLPADETHHEGMLVGVRGSQIAILNRERTETLVFPMAAFVQVRRNGMDANLGDLRRGDAVQVFTRTQFQTEYVTSVAAVSE